jgi:ribose transport system substrate-binding protein
MKMTRYRKWAVWLMPAALLFCTFQIPSAFAGPVEAASLFLNRANATVAKAAALKNRWDGPTTGPKLVKGKKVIFIAGDMRDAGTYGVFAGMREAGMLANWQILPIDLRGGVRGGELVVKQALAQKPSAIVLAGLDAAAQTKGIALAKAANVPVIGWHASTTAGPVEGLFTNITSSYKDAAQIAALYGVVESNSKVGIVVFTDGSNPYLAAKSREMVNTIKQCDTCRLLGVEDLPFATALDKMPSLVKSLVAKHGNKWTHVVAINDFYFDLLAKPEIAATIKENNLHGIAAGDGSQTAYQRIRKNTLQIGTVPEPTTLHGWQIVDEINRAWAKQAPSGYVTPTHLVTFQNIAYDGGAKGLFDPGNDYRTVYNPKNGS